MHLLVVQLFLLPFQVLKHVDFPVLLHQCLVLISLRHELADILLPSLFCYIKHGLGVLIVQSPLKGLGLRHLEALVGLRVIVDTAILFGRRFPVLGRSLRPEANSRKNMGALRVPHVLFLD